MTESRENLETIIREVKQGKIDTLTKIKIIFDSLKPYICAHSEGAPGVQACFAPGGNYIAGPLENLIKVDLADNLLYLIPKAKGEEIDLAIELLKFYNFNMYYPRCDEEQKQLYFYPEDDPNRKGPPLLYGSVNSFPNRTVLGTILVNFEFKKLLKVREFIKKLREGEIPQQDETNSQSAETPKDSSEQTTGSNIPTETEVERRVREKIIKGEGTVRSDDLAEVKKILAELEAVANGSNEERTAFRVWGGVGEEAISGLKSRQKALEINNQTNNNSNQGNQNGSGNNQNNQILTETRTKAFADIVAALNQDPKITDSELDYHQNWKEIIKKFTDLNKIKTFKNDVIAYIEVKRKSKLETDRVKNDVKNAQGKTGEELRKDLKNLKKDEGEKFYEEQREAVEKLAKKSAQEDPESYQRMVVDLIKEQLAKNMVEESELEKEDSETKADWEKIKRGEINQPEEIVAIEKKVTKKIGEIGAWKRFDNLIKLVNEALQSRGEKELKKAGERILKFVTSSNLYDQAVYSRQESLIRQLKERLEIYSEPSQLGSPNKFPWGVVLPIFLLAVLGVILMIMIIRNKRISDTLKNY